MAFSAIFMALTLSLTSLLSDTDLSATDTTDVQVVDFKGYEKYIEGFGDKTLVINFWATWCIPCVKELPYFEQAVSHYNPEDVQVILVSLDFTNQIKARLIPFIEENHLKANVILLDDPDANVWIDKVNPEWSGAIPATIIKKGDKEAFYEKSFHSFEELQQIIKPFLNS